MNKFPFITRRSFLRLSAAGAIVAAWGGIKLPLEQAAARAAELNLKQATLSTSICCYCAVGCGLLVWTDPKTKRSINIEGDPEHPVNMGSLCPKGGSIWQMIEQAERDTEVLYRAPGALDWEPVPWDWAISRIAAKIKETRDASFEKEDTQGHHLNRTLAMANLGTAAVDNEEGWMLQAFLRSLGLIYIDSHARI